MIVSDVNDTTLKEMAACVDAGVTSFKMFMAYPGVFYATDGEILRAMQQAERIGALTMMHAENGIAIDELVSPGPGRGPDRAAAARPDPAAGAGGRGDQPGHHAGRGDRRAAVHRAPVGVRRRWTG